MQFGTTVYSTNCRTKTGGKFYDLVKLFVQEIKCSISSNMVNKGVYFSTIEMVSDKTASYPLCFSILNYLNEIPFLLDTKTQIL